MKTLKNTFKVFFSIVLFFVSFNTNAQNYIKNIENDSLRIDYQPQIESLTNSIQDLKMQNAVLTKGVDNLTIGFSIFAGAIPAACESIMFGITVRGSLKPDFSIFLFKN